MTRWFRSILALTLIAALTICASAHTHPGADAEVTRTVSSWAQEEIARAKELGFVSEALPEDFQAPITRAQFRLVAMSFLAVQEHCDADSFLGMASRYLCETDGSGNVRSVFPDGTEADSVAYYLGLVTGYEDGTFRPDDLITRQEAAVMLTRAYEIYGGVLPETTEAPGFTDEKSIADWARQSVETLASWGVLNGMEDGSFAPRDHYTVEQCILTFLRLYEGAPVSRKNANVAVLFTYEQGLAFAREPLVSDFAGFTESGRVESDQVTFLRVELGGVMQGSSYLYFVYRDGAVYRVDLGICNKYYGVTDELVLIDPEFTEDGSVFSCSAELTEDVYSINGALLHEKGTYQIHIDTDSWQYQVEKIASSG